MTLEFRQLRVLGALADGEWTSGDEIRARTVGVPRVSAALLEARISGFLETSGHQDRVGGALVQEISDYRITAKGLSALHSASAKPDEMNPSEVSS